MADRRHHWAHDPSIRLAGALLLASVWLATRALIRSTALRHQGQDPGLVDYALAWWMVMGASGGTVLLSLGRHIFDQVEVPARWAHRPE